MRVARIKAESGEPAIYHCISRIVGGAFLLGRLEKEIFIKQMWELADFCGLVILNFCVMSNHYHQLILVPGYVHLSDEELKTRVGKFYGYDSSEYLWLEKGLQKGGVYAEDARQRYLRMMGDISIFQKLLKQRFTIWYNKLNNRKGTLWMERFSSVLVEDYSKALPAISAYIDLNPVRAGIVGDPKDYRYCGYAAALGGDQQSRDGIMRIMGIENWTMATAAYRKLLIVKGSEKDPHKRGVISRETLVKTLKEEGRLSLPELLRLRIRYFTDGMVLGSEAFVEKIFQQYRPHFGERRKSGSCTLNEIPCWKNLRVIRNLRESVIQ